jgi:hypothetical protein
MLHKVLEYVSRSVQMNKRRLTRLEDMATLVGVLAPFAGSRAEDVVDQLLDACLVELERGKDNVSDMSLNTVPIALCSVVVAIDRYGLLWTDGRREVFRQILERIPVPRRFEYADLFRAKVADGTPSIAMQHPRVG